MGRTSRSGSLTSQNGTLSPVNELHAAAPGTLRDLAGRRGYAWVFVPAFESGRDRPDGGFGKRAADQATDPGRPAVAAAVAAAAEPPRGRRPLAVRACSCRHPPAWLESDQGAGGLDPGVCAPRWRWRQSRVRGVFDNSEVSAGGVDYRPDHLCMADIAVGAAEG